MSDIYYDSYNEGQEEEYKSPRGSLGWTIKLIFKIIAAILILGTLGILFTRMILARPPADIIRFHWTDAAIAAFDSEDENFRVYSHTLQSYTIDTDGGLLTIPLSGRNRSNIREIDGHFVISNILYTPMLSQLQFTFRFTSSSLNFIEEFFRVEHTGQGSPLWFTLSHEPAGAPITDFYYRQLEHNRYTYLRILFYGINLENVDRLYLNIHHINAINHHRPFMSMCIYDSFLTLDPYVIFSRDTSREADTFRSSVEGPPFYEEEEETYSN